MTEAIEKIRAERDLLLKENEFYATQKENQCTAVYLQQCTEKSNTGNCRSFC